LNKIALLIIGIFIIVSYGCWAQDPNDPGMPDTLIIGTVQVPYPVTSARLVNVPVYAVTDDSISSFELPFTWRGYGTIYPDTLVQFWDVFFLWEDIYAHTCIDSLYIYTHGIYSLSEPHNEPFLYTDSNRVHVITLRFYVNAGSIEQTCVIDTTRVRDWIFVNFAVTPGNVELIPVIIPGAIIVGDGVGIEDESDNNLPSGFGIKQNYPNPFNSETMIEFRIPEPGYVSLEIYNILGEKVKTLVSEPMDIGNYKLRWDGLGNDNQPVPSGVYFYRLTSNSLNQTKKMTLLK
jgi:hypothetical protein